MSHVTAEPEAGASAGGSSGGARAERNVALDASDARAPDEARHVLLCQKFLPEPGGSVRWMYEVYRRWPRPVDVVTHDYFAYPPRTPEFPDAEIPRPASGDVVEDANLRMDRRNIFVNDWGLEDPRRWLRRLRMTRAVGRRLAGGARVICHCIHAVPEVVSLIPLKRLHGDRLRIVCYAHGEEITACRTSRQLTWQMRAAHRQVDLMLCNSRYTLAALGDVAPRRAVVVSPGVELSAFDGAAEAGEAWRREQGLEDKRVLFTLGRMDPRKNHIALVEATARLKDRLPNLVTVLAGEGRERAKLERRAAELGVMDRVRFPGAIASEAKLAMYGGCDLFAMPAIRDGSDIEGFGMVFLEAAACGKPSVAGREGGQPDAVVDGETGRVVDGTDHAAVTDAIAELLGDDGLRGRMGEAARRRAGSFDWSAVVQRTWELVEEHVGR